ncbi:MAG: ADP-ribosylglycohydrolase family protein [Chloroflexota bacterium]|nr:ADP-ribosylglycohydrolase family protein [Chloroflexota bacterium]
MPPRLEQFTGCLIGQCLGDALGFPVEGQPPEICRRHVQEVLRNRSVPIRGRGPFPFGQYSDDSQLARELLESYVSCGRFDPANYAARIASIFEEGRIVGRGRATEEAAVRLAQGWDWTEAGTPAPSAGNGSAMRAAPIGLLFYDRPRELIQAAYDQSWITHQDPRCSAGSVAIAGAVALVLRDEPLEPVSFLCALAERVGHIHEPFAEDLRRLVEWLDLPPEAAVLPISRAGLAADFKDAWQGISPFVVGSVLWSLYAFLRTPDDYWETICTAIEVGGDVDTTAAMAGAISGAHIGVAQLPRELALHLTDSGTWERGELLRLATEAHAQREGTR